MIRWDEAALARVASDAAKPPAERVLDEARRLVPVRTGELRDSLHVEDGGDGSSLVVAGTDHARWVHDGTSDTPAVPFLTDAAALAR